jgi:hypothetical protein
MKQEAKGKIFVGMIVSIVAFGFATGTGFLLGANPLNSQGVLNLTQQSQFPSIPASTTNSNNTTIKSTSQANTSQSSSSNVVTPTNPNTSGNSSSNTPSNNNKSSNSSG